MIKISQDGKTFVDVTEWDDVTSRPGFRKKVDIDSVKLNQILGKYSLPEAKPCGIKSCGTYHKRGYLVSAQDGEDSIEINIGNVCGKKFLGVADWKTMKDLFQKDYNAQRFRLEIAAEQNRVENIKERVLALKSGEQNSDWCYEKMHWHVSKGFSQKIQDALINRARQGNPAITKEVELTREEQAIAREAGGSRFRTETLYQISGLAAVIDYKKLKTLLDVHLGSELDKFKTLDVDAMDYKSLKTWHNWKNRIEKRLKEASDIITDCRRFLLPSNIAGIREYSYYL